METMNKTPQENTRKKQEIVGIHANTMADKNIATTDDLNKWIDALCIDENITKRIFWNEIYQEVKPQLQSTKQFLDTNNHKEIIELPEFKTFLERYSWEQTKKQQKEITNQTAESIEENFNKTSMPEDIKKAKAQESIFNITRNSINTVMKNNGWVRLFETLRKNPISESQNNQIYDFIFEYMESPTNKKKRIASESITQFYKRLGVDYACNDENKKKFIKDIEKRTQKLKEKIGKWEEKEKNKIEKKISKNWNTQEKKDYTQEALDIFLEKIQDNTAIREKFYLPEDKEEIEYIQRYFKKHLEETIPSPNKDDIIKEYGIPLHTIERAGNKVKMNPSDYIEIERRKMEYRHRFASGDWNPREHLFDRLTEYIGKDILKYKINTIIKKQSQYKWTTFSIEKTDALDDSSAWADYIVTYTIPGKQKKRIAAIDLFISDKKWWKGDKENEDQRTQKKESAKIEKIPYSTYIHIFADKHENSYTMEPLKRYVEQLDPTLVYTTMTKMIKDKKTDITPLLESFDKKWPLYTNIKDTIESDKKTVKDIEAQLHQNIFIELEKVAA